MSNPVRANTVVPPGELPGLRFTTGPANTDQHPALYRVPQSGRAALGAGGRRRADLGPDGSRGLVPERDGATLPACQCPGSHDPHGRDGPDTGRGGRTRRRGLTLRVELVRNGLGELLVVAGASGDLGGPTGRAHGPYAKGPRGARFCVFRVAVSVHLTKQGGGVAPSSRAFLEESRGQPLRAGVRDLRRAAGSVMLPSPEPPHPL